MKFTRTKKLTFINNKGGVGKTTLAYNTAVKLANMGYKTVLVDLDPQCNLSKLSLGDYFENNLFNDNQKNIYTVLNGIIKGGSDIDLSVDFQKIGDNENLFILPGSQKLSEYSNILISAYGESTQGLESGFFRTSAINRFLNKKGLDEEIDIFIIDVSPSLELLNRVVFLGTDYFLTPLMPDAFSVQGIENLGKTFENWKENWKKTARVLGRDNSIPADKILDGEGLFIGYIINSYNQYGKKPIKANREWMSKIPEYVKSSLSEKHSRNGLVQKSWENEIASIKDFGQLSPISQELNKAVFDLKPGEDFPAVKGTKETQENVNNEFNNLVNNLVEILEKY